MCLFNPPPTGGRGLWLMNVCVARPICSFKIIVTFCDLVLTFKCTKYRVSTLLVPSVCSWEKFGENLVHSELPRGRQPPTCEHVPNVNIFNLTWLVTLLVTRKSTKLYLDNFGRAIKCRFNFENRPSSFGDRRGLWISPQCSAARYRYLPVGRG